MERTQTMFEEKRDDKQLKKTNSGDQKKGQLPFQYISKRENPLESDISPQEKKIQDQVEKRIKIGALSRSNDNQSSEDENKEPSLIKSYKITPKITTPRQNSLQKLRELIFSKGAKDSKPKFISTEAILNFSNQFEIEIDYDPLRSDHHNYEQEEKQRKKDRSKARAKFNKEKEKEEPKEKVVKKKEKEEEELRTIPPEKQFDGKDNEDYILKRIKCCVGKSHFKLSLQKYSPVWKLLLVYYIKNCFLPQIFNRKLETKDILIARRKKLVEVILNPHDLEYDCKFDNNMMKNFCTGFVNYYTKNRNGLLEAIKAYKIEELKIEVEGSN